MSATFRLGAAILAALLSLSATAEATDLSYRGYLEDGGAPAEGRYDIRLTAYADALSTLPVALPVELEGVALNAGQFAAALPEGLLPAHLDEAWLEVEVRAEGEGIWWALPGRQAVAPKGALCPPAWELTGNAGTNPTSNFLGTTNDQPLEFRVRNGRGFRIEPSPNFWNGLPLTINTLGGSHGNLISDGVRGATISGGGVAPGGTDPDIAGASRNRVTDHYGVVGGGFNNRAGNDSGTVIDASHATVGGGRANTAAGRYSTVAGGITNQATGDNSSVGGGQGNTASGARSTLAGGENNQAVALRSTVGGGVANVAMGVAATVPGGSLNCAGGSYSWAGGLRAKVRPAANPGSGSCGFMPNYPGGEGDVGTFVWNGALPSDTDSVFSTGSQQFIVRAPGGVYFGTVGGSISIPAGRFIHTSTGAHLTTGGTWTNNSARASKTGFERVETEAVLAALIDLPVTRWQYREAPDEGWHLGPTAEDFHERFGLGRAGSIGTVDADGVALAAIQGLHHKLERENTELRAQLAASEARHSQELAALRIERDDAMASLRAELALLRELIAPAVADGGR